MDPGLALLISGLGSAAISGAANYFGSANLNEKNRTWQENMYKQQRKDQEEFYQKYQTPEAMMSSQMKGMLENGINPALMFEGAPTTGQAPVNLPNVPTASNAIISNFTNAADWDVYSKIVQARRLKEETTLLQHQQQKVIAETKLTNYKSFTEGQIGLGQYYDNLVSKNTYGARIEKELNEAAESFYNVRLKSIEEEISRRTKEDVITAIGWSDEKAEQEKKLFESQINEITQNILESQSRAGVNKEKQEEIKQNVKFLYQQTVAKQFENYITRITKDSEANKIVSENTLATITNQFFTEFANEHEGLNPLAMDSFQFALVDALKGVADEKHISVDELLNSKNSLDWRNVVLKLVNVLGPALVFAGATALTGGNVAVGAAAGAGTSTLLQGLFNEPQTVPGAVLGN